MTGDGFLDFARKAIVMHRGMPAAMRSVVSRAYYGIYHLTRRYLEELGFPTPKDESAHRFALVHLANAENEAATDLAALLGEIHERRKRADYDVDDARYETEAFAADTIARADRAARVLECCAAEPVQTTIREGILRYRAKLSAPSRN